MLRFLRCAIGLRTFYALCLFFLFVPLVHAQSATVWSYKGSVLTLSETGSNVVITYQTLSEPLAKSGAHVGDPLFRGQRSGNALHGRVYRFFNPQCEPIGFVVDGAFEADKITLRGIAPGLGLNSCKVETTYYDTLQLTAVAAPGNSQQATLSPAETATFPNQIARCKAGDKEACRAALASPLLTEVGRTEIEAAAALPTTAAAPVYLLFPFECVIENGKPVFKHSAEPYYHEALDYRPASSYAVCGPDKGGWVQSLFSTCNMIELTSLRLVCNDGIARTPELTAANTTPFAKASRIDGDSLLVPIFNQWRSADVPEAYHRAPAGWGLVPHPNAVANLSSLEPFFGPKHIR